MASNKSKDVLIVDDDDAIRNLLCTALTHAGLTCDDASHGVDALQKLKTTDYSVLLLDLMMPQLDGSGVLTELQTWQQPQDRKPVIVVVTAFPERERPALPGEMVQAVVRKPFDVTELTELVAGCVAARRAHAEQRAS
ncbi:MAG TPA: response regulator [Thermoanaerobaculia bacterium]